MWGSWPFAWKMGRFIDSARKTPLSQQEWVFDFQNKFLACAKLIASIIVDCTWIFRAMDVLTSVPLPRTHVLVMVMLWLQELGCHSKIWSLFNSIQQGSMVQAA